MWQSKELKIFLLFWNFYSHIPCGMWPAWVSRIHETVDFYSHIPCGMWPYIPEVQRCWLIFLLTHPLWDVTLLCYILCCCQSISTHTSLVGCDQLIGECNTYFLHFYSHIPCGMWRKWLSVIQITLHFYSHIPCGMWQISGLTLLLPLHFYSHIPCGMWRSTHHRSWSSQQISTHTSLVGCDSLRHTHATLLEHFYSHIPCGMWLNLQPSNSFTKSISTHTSLVGCDFLLFLLGIPT